MKRLDLSQPVTARDLAAQRADIALGLVVAVEARSGPVDGPVDDGGTRTRYRVTTAAERRLGLLSLPVSSNQEDAS